MNMERLIEEVYAELYKSDLIYRGEPREGEYLERAAAVFAADVARLALELPPGSCSEAFGEHRAASPYYPRPSDINRELTFIRARVRALPPLPRSDRDRCSPETPDACYRALRGDERAKKWISDLIRERGKR